ncbi:hypothetical protein K4F52_005811 [Lecanicillium sp. MT-2017a]|nr:hypothetical protein K4F52_005811 [Lecanicillium sp. MT-2017a]
MRLCHALVDGEFGRGEASQWEDIPRELRYWLQRQDGLKLSGRSITSVSDLLEAHGLIRRQTKISEDNMEDGIIKIFIEIVSRYYHLVASAARESRIEHLTSDTLREP